MAPNDTYPQHVVTAVIVAHDGAAWLPHVIDGLLEQTRPVQRVVAVDTGSRDRSGAVLAGKLGQQVVFGMDRATGYGTAVARALQHKAASTPVAGRPPQGRGHPGRQDHGRSEPVEWIWLLHDDSEPAADALEQLLRGAAETPAAAVLGPKVMDWSDREVILEAGVTIDTAGRRITSIEPREVDQGQHDGDRDSLAVGSAGMLIRRDVWDQVRGFDTSMGLFREDVDLCWRVHAAGYRVRVITDAVIFHVQGISKRRRAVSIGRRAPLLDRRNALLTLAGNLPGGPMVASLIGNVTVSLLRALFFLVAKRVTAALDETAAVLSVLGHPLRLLRVRQMRARGRRAAYGRLRADLPPGRSFRRIIEFAVSMTSAAQADTAGSHHATEDPDEADFLLTDSGIVQRVLTSPVVLLFLALLIVTGVAERSLLGAGSLGGGALLPATGGASGLWHEYVQAFHPSGVGSPSTAPPYLAVVAALATVLAGKAWLAVDVLLLGSVPIAGMAAYLAVRRVTTAMPVRVWAAASYALLPVASGAIAAGRLGTAAAFAIIPVIGLLAGRMFSQPPRIARRAAWATGLAIALGAAFVPLLWLLAVLAAIPAAVVLRRTGPAVLLNLAIVVLVPPVLLIPWTVQLATHPAAMLLEVGTQQPGLASPDLPARAVLLLSPGGPGLPPAFVTAGLVLAALLALLATRRRLLVLSGWTVAVLGLLTAVLVSHVSVRPAAGGPAVLAWPGAALAVAAAGLLLAAAAGGDSLGGLLAAGRTGLRRLTSGRGLAVCVLGLAACSAPLLAAGFWLLNGVSGPVGPDTGQVVPALVSVSAAGGAQTRTLVLSVSGSRVSYRLLRGPGPTLGDADLIPVPAAQRGLRTAVSALVAPSGGQAVSQSQLLADYNIGFVLMRAPVSNSVARTLDGVPGLRAVSMTATFDLWRLTRFPSRASVTEPDGAIVPVSSGPVSVSGVPAPAAGGVLTLAEPAGGWKATLNGRPLAEAASPAGSWEQAFRLPPGGGTLEVSRNDLGHEVGIAIELLAVLVVAALGLPGVRAAETAAAKAASAGPAAGLAAEGAATGRVPASTAGGAAGSRDLAAAGVAAAARSLQAGGAAGSPADRGAGRAGSDRHSGGAELAGPGRTRSRAGRRGGGRRDSSRPDSTRPVGNHLDSNPASPGLEGTGRPDSHGGGDLVRPGGPGQPGDSTRPRRGLGRLGRRGSAAEPAGPQPDRGESASGRGGRGRPVPGAAADAVTAAWPAGMPSGRPDRAGPGSSRYEGTRPGSDDESAGYDRPARDGSGYDRPGRSGQGDEPGRPRRDGAVRSPTGAWPYPDDADLDAPGSAGHRGGDRGDPARPRPYAPEASRPPTAAAPYPARSADSWPPAGPAGPSYEQPSYEQPSYEQPSYGQPSYGQPSYDAPPRPEPDPPGPGRPDRGSPVAGRPEPHRADRGWQGRGLPGPAGDGYDPGRGGTAEPGGPDPRRADRGRLDRGSADRGRPDPAWQEARWRAENRPPDRPGGSAGRGGPAEPRRSWPESEPQSWPSQQGSSWSTGGQPSSWSGAEQPRDRGGSGAERGYPADYQPGDEYGGWPGADSLDPLPSAEVHHSGPPRGPGDRSRRRWPAPERDDVEERDAW